MFARSRPNGADAPSEGDRPVSSVSDTVYFFPRKIREEELHAYVDDRLPPLERMRIEAYLSRYPQQAARARLYRAQNEGFRALYNPPLPLTPAVLQELGHRFSRSMDWSARFRFFIWSAAVLAILMILGFVTSLTSQ